MSLVPRETWDASVVQSNIGNEQMVALFQQAVGMGESGVGVLERLVDLQDRMQRRSAERQFKLDLAAFQEECPPITRASRAKITPRNGGQGYEFKYADLEEIITTVRPILSKYGFSFRFDSEATAAMLKCTCILSHAHGHSEPSSFTLPTESASGATPQQKFGGALTYAKRMTLISSLGLSLSDPDPDDEAKANVPRITEEQSLNLVALLEETNVKPSQFCARFKIESIGDLPAPLYNEAVRALESRRKAAAK